MAVILILYSTTDGHTREICQKIMVVLENHGHKVLLLPVEEANSTDLLMFDKIIIGARIRYGRHKRNVFNFIKHNLGVLESKPSAFFSVNVVARKPGKDSPDNNPYIKKFLQQIKWEPNRVAVFAGEINYKKYNYFDRLIIRLIMFITHGPTSPDAVKDFTDWDKVVSFGEVINEM